MLQGGQIRLGIPRQRPQVGEFRVGCRAYDVTLAQLGSRVLGKCGAYVLQQAVAIRKLRKYGIQRFTGEHGAALGYRSQLGQSPAQLHQFARQYLSRRRPGYDSLQVAQAGYMVSDSGTDVRLGEKGVDAVVSGIQFVYVHGWHSQPAAEHPGAHRALATVYHVHQGAALRTGGTCEYLQIAQGETVHPDEIPLLYAGKGAYIVQSAVLGLLQIDQKGTCGRNAEREATHGETLETLDLELVAKTLHGRLIGEGPLVHGRDIVLVSEPFLCSLLITPLHE